MKYVFLLLCAFVTLNGFSQIYQVTKRPTIFAGTSSFDFKSTTGGSFRGLKDNYSGLGISYWQGLSSHIDFAINYNFSKVFYPFTNGLNYRTRRNLHEADFAFNLKLLDDNHFVVPYITAGIGGYVFASTNGSYAPLGAGLQFNIKHKVFFLTNFQYRAAVTNEAKSHLFYGLNIGVPLTQRKRVLTDEEKNAIAMAKAMANIKPIVYDRDKDGVPDSIDNCPNTPGSAKYKGCPQPIDTDQDGVPDSLDKCPTVAGVESTGGCPLADQDKDSIPDVVDLCPTVPGLEKYNGCPIPDTDNDGLNDEVDKCPEQAGPASNGGCPYTKPDDKSYLNPTPVEEKDLPDTVGRQLLSYDIFFYSGLTIVPDASQKILLGIVDVLYKNPNAKAVIWGYTDNVEFGAAAKVNSAKRALAVATYLMNRGISKLRITTIGLGAANPKAPNNSMVNRSQNRRVEVKIVN